jgi:hypothetical protein
MPSENFPVAAQHLINPNCLPQTIRRRGILSAPCVPPLFFVSSISLGEVNFPPMSAEAVRRAHSMTLPELVKAYLAAAGKFGQPVALSSFGLSHAETERLFSAFDEDYHISRFFQFSQEKGEKFSINGIPATHVSLDAEIETIL